LNPEIGTRILAALTAERNGLRDFVALLEREQNTLVENIGDQLLELAEQKSSRALALTDLVEARHLLFRNNLPELSATAIQTWLQSHIKSAWPIWQEILVLAHRARQLNQNSGELIQMKMRYNQQALMVLSNAASKANLYGPDGQPSFASSSGKPIASA
jgi:flagella synthesis protein FlgN